MTTIWNAALNRAYDSTLNALATALRDCPADLWEASLWLVRKDDPYVWPVQRVDALFSDDRAEHERLLQVHSAFWNVAYHALFHLEFYLSGAVLPFTPLPPFREDEHHSHVVPARTYTRDELLTYLAHIHQKSEATFAILTEAIAACPLPRDSQHAGRAFLDLLLENLLHAQEHTAQLRLFLSQQANRRAAIP